MSDSQIALHRRTVVARIEHLVGQIAWLHLEAQDEAAALPRLDDSVTGR
jgi:hypothetical protein